MARFLILIAALLLAFDSAESIAGAGSIQAYVANLTTTLDPRAAWAVGKINGTGRQLLALRSYLRSAGSIAAQRSWSEAQIDSYQGSRAQQLLEAVVTSGGALDC